jgi:hypothetical protein
LRNQRLIGVGFETPAEVVSWLGAVQAQDYTGAKWALGQRMQRATDGAIERAFAAGEILRTHVMRPTWHFVAPEDLRWLLALTAPRVRALLRYYDAKLALTPALLARSVKIIEAALADGRQLTRRELAIALSDAGIEADGQRLAHLMMHAELDALICSGANRGKQFTYALVDARVPVQKARGRDEALRELTLRYFTSHGPALPQDFAWWSGLTIRDANEGLKLASDALSELVVEGRRYWRAEAASPPKLSKPVVHLLPNYDEHLIAYKERSAAFDRSRMPKLGSRDNALSNHLITLNGQVVGGWKRDAAGPSEKLTLTLLTTLSPTEQAALKQAESRLAKFAEP